jgi:hypothetical protein
MSCLEHSCIRCDWWTTDNQRGPVCCPKCGADVRTTSDEDPREFRDDRDDIGDDEGRDLYDPDLEDLDDERD